MPFKSTSGAPPPADSDDEPSTALAITDKGLLQKFANMATMIPSEDEGDMSRIFEQIINAARWDTLDAPWEASKADELAGKKLVIRGAKRRPSDFNESLGFFLVLDCVDFHTGEPITFINGSVGVTAQVVRAYALGALPLVAEVVVAARPTTRGFRPHHLKIHGSLAGAAAEQPADAP